MLHICRSRYRSRAETGGAKVPVPVSPSWCRPRLLAKAVAMRMRLRPAGGPEASESSRRGCGASRLEALCQASKVWRHTERLRGVSRARSLETPRRSNGPGAAVVKAPLALRRSSKRSGRGDAPRAPDWSRSPSRRRKARRLPRPPESSWRLPRLKAKGCGGAGRLAEPRESRRRSRSIGRRSRRLLRRRKAPGRPAGPLDRQSAGALQCGRILHRHRSRWARPGLRTEIVGVLREESCVARRLAFRIGAMRGRLRTAPAAAMFSGWAEDAPPHAHASAATARAGARGPSAEIPRSQ